MEETTPTTTEQETETPGVPSGIEVKRKFAKCLLEILIYGHNDDKEKIQRMAKEMQTQMDTRKAVRRVRILWYVDEGQKTNEEKKQWLLENCNAKYYIFAPENNKVEKDYVQKLLSRIQEFEAKYNLLKNAGISFSKNKTEEVQPTQEQGLHISNKENQQLKTNN